MARGNSQEPLRQQAPHLSSFIRLAAGHRAPAPWLASVCREQPLMKKQGRERRARTQASQPAGVDKAGQGVRSQCGQSWERNRRNFSVQIRPAWNGSGTQRVREPCRQVISHSQPKGRATACF